MLNSGDYFRYANGGENLMNYYFGFSWKGLIVFLLPMIPNIFYFLIPASDVSGNNANSHLILDVLEHGSQAIFIFLLIFVIRKQASEMLCAIVKKKVSQSPEKK